jgi:methionyl-tRNA synthetase
MEEISFEEWQRMDFRVARIIAAKPHPNADKLYVLEVDLGEEKRTLVAGLRQHYTEEQLKGKLCIVFCNLKPAVIRGVKSEGMLLAAEDKGKGKVVLIAPESEVEPGSKVK